MSDPGKCQPMAANKQCGRGSTSGPPTDRLLGTATDSEAVIYLVKTL